MLCAYERMRAAWREGDEISASSVERGMEYRGERNFAPAPFRGFVARGRPHHHWAARAAVRSIDSIGNADG